MSATHSLRCDYCGKLLPGAHITASAARAAAKADGWKRVPRSYSGPALDYCRRCTE